MCGSGRIAKGVKSSLVQIIREANDLSVEEAQDRFDE
jgi:sulfite reductase alpha subunit-like flavoprotein